MLTYQGTPTPMMGKSLLFKMCNHNQRPGVQLNSTLFREVCVCVCVCV